MCMESAIQARYDAYDDMLKMQDNIVNMAVKKSLGNEQILRDLIYLAIDSEEVQIDEEGNLYYLNSGEPLIKGTKLVWEGINYDRNI